MSLIKKAIIILCVSGIHLLFTLWCISKVSIGGDGITPDKFWLSVWDVAGFPLLYLEKLEYHFDIRGALGFDWLPLLLVVCNSSLWGFVIVWAILSIRHILRRKP